MVTQFPILRIDRTTIQFALYYTTLIIVCQVLFCDFCCIFNCLTACSLCKIVNELLQYESRHQKSGWFIDPFILLHRLTFLFNLQREQKMHPLFSIGAICFTYRISLQHLTSSAGCWTVNGAVPLVTHYRYYILN